jgi:hypothetical protein
MYVRTPRALPTWPAEVEPLLRTAVTVDYASRTARGVPITVPVSPTSPTTRKRSTCRPA